MYGNKGDKDHTHDGDEPDLLEFLLALQVIT